MFKAGPKLMEGEILGSGVDQKLKTIKIFFNFRKEHEDGIKKQYSLFWNCGFLST
jgi:hypothetical protein